MEAIFTTGKAAYIEAYAQRMAPVLAAEKARWAPADGEPLLEPLRALFEPIMIQTDQICDGIGYPVELRIGPETVVLDFPKRVVREPIPDEKFRYGFEIPPELVRTVVRDQEPDWVNTIFLSTRFKAWRVGGFNEYLYTFFKCLTDERIAYADGWFAESHDDSASITMDGWEIQRRCPHLKADLSKFGVDRGVDVDLQSARLAVEPEQRPMPDLQGTRAAIGEAVSERRPAVLRRRHGPAGSTRDHVAPLSLSVRDLESDSPAHDTGYKSEPLGMFMQRFRIWGSSDLRRWLPLDI